MSNYLYYQGGFKSVPTREQVCGVNTTGQGLIVTTDQYGLMPWWDPCIAWIKSVKDRATAYKIKLENENTHITVELPNGKPLYNENGQFYSPAKFPSLDMTNGETKISNQFLDLICEIIDAGLIPEMVVDEQMENSLKCGPLLMNALAEHPQKLNRYGSVRIGWDGVFYGWPNDLVNIPLWGKNTRAAANGDIAYLIIEHNPGHIPLGEGDGDYRPGGKMQDFDVVFSEYDTNQNPPYKGSPIDGTSWQVVGRMVRPYNRNAFQPEIGNDDPNPPFVLLDSIRGKRYYCAYEFAGPVGMYDWVRCPVNMTDLISLSTAINNTRLRYKESGCKYTG